MTVNALAPAAAAPADVAPTAPTRRRGWWKLPVLALAACLAFVELRGHLPDLGDTWAALRRASPFWLTVAVLLQLVSTAAFGEQERRLLKSFGVAMRVRTSMAVTLARSAMATALPGGSAIAAAYGFRQFRARGATRPIAATVTLLCGVVSFAGLISLYVGDGLVQAGALKAVLIAVPSLLVLVAAARLLRRSRPSPAAGRLRCMVHEAVVAATAVPGRRWALVLALAALNWLADLLSLLACLRALGLTVPLTVVGAAYLGAQLARQIPATAGGIGVIEAELILAMTTTGHAPAAAATAAVLTYRLLSCWALLPIGAACWAALRPAATAAVPQTPAATAAVSQTPAATAAVSQTDNSTIAPTVFAAG